MTHAKALLIFAAGLVASSYITYLIISTKIPIDLDKPEYIVIATEDEAVRARAAAAKLERERFIADKKQGWEIMAKGWKR